MSQYRLCRYTNKIKYCACSLYVRVNNTDPHFAFIDFCQGVDGSMEDLKFKHFKHPRDKVYPKLNCGAVVRDPNNDNEWKDVPVSFNYFKCAKLTSACNDYAVTLFILFFDASNYFVFVTIPLRYRLSFQQTNLTQLLTHLPSTLRI